MIASGDEATSSDAGVAGSAGPDVSVIVPAYGIAHLVGEALASLQAQGHANWEAIVVDDGAPDDVAGALAPFADDRRIRLLRTDNRGVSTARNRAIATARAPLIALLDGDDLYAPDYLSRMIAALDADPRLGFVSCDAIYFGEPMRRGQRFSQYSRQRPPVTLDRVLTRRFNVFTAAILRRAAFDAIGGYDPVLPAAEDFDLWVRLLEAGWRGGYVAAPLACYRRRPDSLSRRTDVMARALASAYRAAARRLDGRLEARSAARMAARIEREVAWAEGEALIRRGETAEGLRLLRSAQAWRRSPRWLMAMPFMLALPSLAPPLLRGRHRNNDAA